MAGTARDREWISWCRPAVGVVDGVADVEGALQADAPRSGAGRPGREEAELESLAFRVCPAYVHGSLRPHIHEC